MGKSVSREDRKWKKEERRVKRRREKMKREEKGKIKVLCKEMRKKEKKRLGKRGSEAPRRGRWEGRGGKEKEEK